jgi:hypothetical protein
MRHPVGRFDNHFSGTGYHRTIGIFAFAARLHRNFYATTHHVLIEIGSVAIFRGAHRSSSSAGKRHRLQYRARLEFSKRKGRVDLHFPVH